MNNTAYRKALWVELIAFDNRAEDMGVQAYLDNLGLIPDTVSIFMWGPDFVHLHNGLETDGEFPVDIGAYMDPYFDGPKKSRAAVDKIPVEKADPGVPASRRKSSVLHFSLDAEQQIPPGMGGQ